MIAFWLGFVACVGVDPIQRPDPEICNDGIDNDGDGLVDCDDEACGGLPCNNVGGNDTAASDEPIEIVIESSDCCEFSFTDDNCAGRSAGTFDIVNRTDDEGTITEVRCDPLGNDGTPIAFRTVSNPTPVEFLTDVAIPPQSTVTVEGIYNCLSDIAFEVNCAARAEVGTFADERAFLVRGRFGL